MTISNQRLGDNPKDHDGSFTGFYPASAADVNGLRPDISPKRAEDPRSAPEEKKQDFEPWKVYPPPPPAHWHWQSGEAVGEGGEGIEASERYANGQPKLVSDNAPVDSRGTNGSAGFNFEDCEIPGKDERDYCFALDDGGLYQVYAGLPPTRGQTSLLSVRQSCD